MLETIREILIYLILAILLGYIFGWLITKALSKKNSNEKSINDEEYLKLKEEHQQYRNQHKDLLSENNRVLLENREQKLKIHNLSKSIQELKVNCSKQEKQHELEMSAFLKEREELIKKHSAL